MPGIDRTLILTGPALVTFGGQSFWSKGDVKVDFQNTYFDIDTAHFGKADKRASDRKIEVSFEPEGRFTTGLAAVIWPYAALAIGASIYGASDRALIVWARDGKKITIPNASITGMPDIRLGMSKTIDGNIKFTGLLAKDTDPATAGAYYVLATATYPGDTGFAVGNIPTSAYASAWGGDAPWDSFQTEQGWTISFGLDLKPQMVDSFGTVDMTLAGLTVTAKGRPVGPTETDILSKMLPTSGLGNSIAAAANDLVITGSIAIATVYNAGITDGGFEYGSGKRIGYITWEATRTVTDGVADPLFSIIAD
jgi:hypothetical protein